MDNFEFYLWLIFLVATLLYRLFKGGKQEKPATRTPKPKPNFDFPMFEELAQQGREEMQEEAEATQNDFYPSVDSADEHIDEIEEEYLREGKAEWDMGLKHTEKAPEFSEYDAYDEEENEPTLAETLRKELSDPEGARKAIILSEIIQRKY